MKKFTPYILAYLIVATCTAIYPHIDRQIYPYVYRHLVTPKPTMMPADSVVIISNPGIPHDELVAKLRQVGLSEAQAPIVRPAPVATAIFRLVYHFTFDAVMLAAFAGLVILFQRKFSQSVSNHAA